MQKVQLFTGRIQAVVFSKLLGSLGLMGMVFVDNIFPPVALAAIYIVRSGFMNCCYPIEESILMDYVPKEARARWKSLESVSMFGWCGSALIGGFLGDSHGYTFTFFITAIVQTVGILIILPLTAVVKQEQAIGEATRKSKDMDIEEPLLADDIEED